MNIKKDIINYIKFITSKIGPRNFVIISISVLIFLIVSYNIYKLIYSKEKFTSNSTDSDSLGKKHCEMLLFYTNQCGYCKKAKPEWAALKEKYKNKSVKGYNILFTEIDCSNSDENISKKMKKFNIVGVPTIILIKGDQVINYESKPTTDLLSEFLETNL